MTGTPSSLPRVVALYRYPVKGFTPEEAESLQVQPDGRIAGDRAFALRFADASEPRTLEDGSSWWSKRDLLSLMDTPGIARMTLRYDDEGDRMTVSLDGTTVTEAGLDEAGRREISGAVEAFVVELGDAPRAERAGALPLVLEGTGDHSRFQDRTKGFITVHSRESLGELAGALGDESLDERRFRSNIVIEGVPAWSELEWSGRLRIGEVEFETQGPVGRCLAVHANPETGERDRQVMNALTGPLGQDEPTFGRLLLPAGEGGVIRLGDAVEVLD